MSSSILKIGMLCVAAPAIVAGISSAVQYTVPLNIESVETSNEYYSRNDPANLRCVFCCRMFPKKDISQVQSQRTYCYVCGTNNKNAQ